MKLCMDFFKVGISHMGIYLGSCYVAMAKHGLHAADVGPIHEEIGRKTVSQRVRANVFGNAC